MKNLLSMTLPIRWRALNRYWKCLGGFYSDGRFEDMDDALEVIGSYKKAVSILKEVEED